MVPQNVVSGVDPTTRGVATTTIADRLALLREVRSDTYTAAVIREALAAGWSQRRIHRETGLSRDMIRDVLDRTSAA